MKRSEAIEIIGDLLELIRLDNDLDKHGKDHCADTILIKLEDMGMLPPKSLDSVCVKKGKVAGYSMFFEWEPENEG